MRRYKCVICGCVRITDEFPKKCHRCGGGLAPMCTLVFDNGALRVEE